MENVTCSIFIVCCLLFIVYCCMAKIEKFEDLEIWNIFFLSNGPSIHELYDGWLKHNGISNKNLFSSEADEPNFKDEGKSNFLNQLKSKKTKYTDLGF